MGIISESDLQELGDLAGELLFNSVCEILTPASSGGDGMGGESATTYSTTATVACAVVDDGSLQGRFIADQFVGNTNKQVLLPRKTAISLNQRIRCDNVTYEVVDVLDPTSYEVIRRVNVATKEV